MVSESQGTIIIYSLVAYTIHLLTKECTLKCTIMYHNNVETKDSIFLYFHFHREYNMRFTQEKSSYLHP